MRREPKDVPLGDLAPPADIRLTGVKDCPVIGAKLPLVIFSHGRGGWFGGHSDTAEALADAGFVVAAINHPGDNGNDSSQRDKMSVWQSRPVDMVRLLDFMLHDWKDKAVIDPARIGFFGFSLGGYTGLVLVGAMRISVGSLCFARRRRRERIASGRAAAMSRPARSLIRVSEPLFWLTPQCHSPLPPKA
jgi:predicted dienelactone hydrolase